MELVLLGALAFLLFGMLGHSSGRYRAVITAARQVRDQLEQLYASEHEYAVAHIEDFPDLDRAYYERATRTLEELGFRRLTDLEDLTLSRIDSGLFTGTRWEGNLTELEMQWGRTIGQMPSPCNHHVPPPGGNPLLEAYRWDQGP